MTPPRRRSRYPGEAGPYPPGAAEPFEDEPIEDAEAEEEPVGERHARRRVPSAAAAGRLGLRYIADLTAKDTEGVTLVEPAEHGWVVDVEVVEDRRIPSSGDILAIYEVDLDDEGNLLSYRRARCYRRGTGDYGGGRSR